MLQTFLPGFLHWLRFEKRYSPHTLKSYEKDLKQLDAYLAEKYPNLDDIQALELHHLRSWLADLKDEQDNGAATLNHKISTLNSFYKHLQRQGVTDQNPARKLRSLKIPERLPAFLKEAETGLLLEEVNFGTTFRDKTDRLICELLYHTGLRRQELVNIKEQDIEWSLRQLRVLGKGNKERLVPLGETMLSSIRDYLEAKGALAEADPQQLLVLENGRPVYAQYVYRAIRERLDKNDITTLTKKSPHVMRHTFATHLLNNGANIQAIKDLLGHSSLAATQVYTHNNIARLKEIHKTAHPREQPPGNK